jgi:beta-glucosidase
MDKFPKCFYFGASTSSYQVEGGNYNNWSVWEKKNAKRLARDAKNKYRHLPNYNQIIKEASKTENYISGFASDQIHHYKGDVQIMSDLGLNAYRFSIEWSRIEPKQGEFNQDALKYYQNLINELKQNNIEPFATLWHWTVPVWFDEIGGFTKAKNLKYFIRFVNFITKNLKGVKFWIVLNEPEVFANKSYLLGDWPPQKKNPILALRVFQNLIKSHNQAYQIIKKNNQSSQIGVAKHNTYFEAYKNRFWNKIAVKILDYFANQYFLRKTIKYLDFIGLNYYFHHRVGGNPISLRHSERSEESGPSDMGWELYPAGIYHLLLDLKKYKKPIYITENGLADSADANRAWYIQEILKNIKRAIDEGVNVKGYLHWSLLDNFEWADGFWPKFGLVAVDFKTQKRTIRPSARIYDKTIQQLSS